MHIESIKYVKQTPEIYKYIYDFARNPKGILTLSGKPGIGKTYAAKAIYNSNTTYRLPSYDHEEGIFVTERDLADEWLESFNNQMINMKKYKMTKLLVIDDFGSKEPTPAFKDFLFSLIDYRCTNMHSLGTVLTTNLNSMQIEDVFGLKVLSRLYSGDIVLFQGKDRRKMIKDFSKSKGSAVMEFAELPF